MFNFEKLPPLLVITNSSPWRMGRVWMICLWRFKFFWIVWKSLDKVYLL